LHQWFCSTRDPILIFFTLIISKAKITLNMENDQIKDKAIFVVGLMAAFLAFSSYKEELSQIHLQIGQRTPTLSSLFLFFIGILSLSVYFFAIHYLKFNYPRFQNSFVFKTAGFLANMFYSLGILFPLFILLLWIVPIIPTPPNKFMPAVLAFDIFGGIFAVSLAIFNAVSQQNERRKKEIENIDQNKAHALQHALQLFENKFYGEAIVESFKVLEIFLREILLQKLGIYTEGISPSRIIEVTIKHEILDKRAANQVNKLRKIRNLAVHSDKPVRRREAERVLKAVRSILESVPPFRS